MRADKKSFGILKKLFIIGVIAVALLEFAIVRILHLGHGYFWFEDLPAFGSLYGFVSCILIIITAKFVLNRIITKREDYYD